MYEFPRKMRLSRRRDYAAVFNARCSAADQNIIIYIRPNELAFSRLGLSVGRRIGPATVRNRCKRRIREAFRLERTAVEHPGYDIVCVARPALASLDDYRASLRSLLPAAIAKHARRVAARR